MQAVTTTTCSSSDADRFGVMVADVSGHGAPAAIVMAMIRAVFHTYPGIADDPPAVLHHINRHFRFLWDTAMYATAVYGVFDAQRRTLRLACAGHPPPLLVSRGTLVTPLPVDPVMCLLWQELADVPCSEHALQPGDRVAFYTDGITDRQAPNGDPCTTRIDWSPRWQTLEPCTRGHRHRLVSDVETFAVGWRTRR